MDTPSNPRPSLSVALCTYNGATYLREQWYSLLAQEWLPDEVIVSDDGSTDGTLRLVEELATAAPFPVRVLAGEQRLGYNGNFGRAIAACTGDLIFLCDQDDAWLPHKTRRLTTYLLDNPVLQIAFCDALVADEQLHPTDRRFWDVVRFGEADQQAWQRGEAMHILLNGNRAMGCSMVLRQSFRSVALPIPANVPGGYIYDGWLALVGAALNQIGFVAEPLQYYRTHTSQQVGVRPPDAGPPVRLRDRFNRPRDLKLGPFRQQQTAWQNLLTLLGDRVGAQAPGLAQLRHRLAHLTMRATLPTNRLARFWPVGRSLLAGHYHRYADADANRLAPFVAATGDLLE